MHAGSLIDRFEFLFPTLKTLKYTDWYVKPIGTLNRLVLFFEVEERNSDLAAAVATSALTYSALLTQTRGTRRISRNQKNSCEKKKRNQR